MNALIVIKLQQVFRTVYLPCFENCWISDKQCRRCVLQRLIIVYTVFSGMPVRIFRVNTVGFADECGNTDVQNALRFTTSIGRQTNHMKC